jgi:hypothetical protein
MPIAAIAETKSNKTAITAGKGLPGPVPAMGPVAAQAAIMGLHKAFGNRAVRGMLQRQAVTEEEASASETASGQSKLGETAAPTSESSGGSAALAPASAPAPPSTSETAPARGEGPAEEPAPEEVPPTSESAPGEVAGAPAEPPAGPPGEESPAGILIQPKRVCTQCDDDSPVIQAKLALNEPGDTCEQQADAIADAVMGGPHSVPAPMPISSLALQREEAEEDEGEDFPLEGKKPSQIHAARSRGRAPPAAEPASDPLPEPLESHILSRLGGGSALDSEAREFMESRFQSDFSEVRIHNDAQADSINRQLSSYAFTSGRDIFFARGQYAPGSASGRHLLAHELTHVVQQAGRVSPVRRFGTWAHNEIQKALRAVDSDLITEAPIPGGIGRKEALAKLGFADLYKADGHAISGVRAVEGKEGDALTRGDPPLIYKNINIADMLTHTSESGSAIVSAPKLAARIGGRYRFTHTPGFPANFSVAEIKPLFFWPSEEVLINAKGHGAGLIQVDNYIRGFTAFVSRVFADTGGVTTPATSGSTMDWAGKLPDTLDYGKFAQQNVDPPPAGAVLKRDDKKRLWAYAPLPGSVVYFLLPLNLAKPAYRQDLQTYKGLLDKLLVQIQKPPKVGNKLGPKRRPGVPPRTQRSRRPQRTLVVQRAGEIQDSTWQARWEAWEKDRAAWSGTKATPGAEQFLEREAKGAVERANVDKKLGITTPGYEAETKQLKSAQLWAGKSGWILGLLRFRFGWLFEKFEKLFAKIKERFDKFRDGASSKINFGGITIDWKKAALKVVGQLVVEFLKTLVAEAFTVFANCVNALIAKIIGHFVEEMKEDLAAYLQPYYDKFEGYKTEMENRYGPLIDGYEKALETISEIQEFLNILSWIEVSLRLLIEALSCATPPALGCLWGLLAQIGFSAAAGMAIATHAFKEYIARPAARSLVDGVVSDTIKEFIQKIFDAVGLGDYARDVEPCKPSGDLAGERYGKKLYFPNNSPGFKEFREQMEKKYGSRMMKDLQGVLTKGGAPASEQDIKDLLKQIQDANLSGSELKNRLEKAARAGGKVEIDKVSTAGGGAKGGEGPARGGASETGPGAPVYDASKAPLHTSGVGRDVPNLKVYVVPDPSHEITAGELLVTVNVWKGNTLDSIFKNVKVKFLKKITETRGGRTVEWYYYTLLESRTLAPRYPNAWIDMGTLIGYRYIR